MGQIQRQIAESRRNACNCSGHKMRRPSCFAFGSLAKCFLDSDAFLTKYHNVNTVPNNDTYHTNALPRLYWTTTNCTFHESDTTEAAR